MQTYSPFFQTLHDEQGPTGILGRGTHSSILRATVFHDATGQPLQKGQFLDFAIIWDEDHDVRVIEPIEKIYRSGLLSSFLIFGERKGGFTTILADENPAPSLLSDLEAKLNAITQAQKEDPWTARVVNLEKRKNSPIIDAPAYRVGLYLKNLVSLWQLGIKPPSLYEGLFNPAYLTKVEELELSIRSANCLLNGNIVLIGDLVQKTEQEMLRLPNMGRKALNEIKEVLALLGLHLGMEIPYWPPNNIEAHAKLWDDRENSPA